MPTIEPKGWVYAKPSYDAKRVVYEFSQYDYESWAKDPQIDRRGEYKSYRKISEHTIRIDFEPPELEPRQMIVDALEEQKTAIRAEMGKRIAEIEDQISKLQAIEYEAPISDIDGLPGHIPF